MKRRSFLKAMGVTLASLPIIGNRPLAALSSAPTFDNLRRLTAGTDKIFVLVQLRGGNDGLNTLVPKENPLYYERRPTIAILKENTLPLTDTLGWHPSCEGLRILFDEGRLAIVQGVTYPNPNRSHFRGTDIWITATDANVFESTGWVGRYLELTHPEYPDTLPTDPLAIEIGGFSSRIFQTSKGNVAVTFSDPEEFYQLVGESPTPAFPPAPDTPAGKELEFVRTIATASNIYSKRVKEAADKGYNAVEYPEDNDLAQSLKIVARLIAGGLQTPIYLVSIRGNAFDTHANQGGVEGEHATLLAEVSSALRLFLDDLRSLELEDQVAGMTFSEFGRRVQENGSLGTDHGTAAPLFVFGGSVNGGMIFGEDPDLENLDNRGDLLMQYDYRQVYSSVLAQWFQAPETQIEQILFRDFTELPLFKIAGFTNEPSPSPTTAPLQLLQMFPAPANGSVTLRYRVQQPGTLAIAVYNLKGQHILTLLQQFAATGEYQRTFDTTPLRSGTYILQLQLDRYQTYHRLDIVH